MYAGGKVIVLLGPPGSGKGTQAARLSAALGIPAISTGEMLRRECQSGSELGQAVQSALDAGQLVSDDLINRVVASRVSGCDCESGCILDGYPRTVSQARFLERLLAERGMARPVVFDFQVDVEEVVARLSGRRQCPQCGQIFSATRNAQAAELFCDKDGSPLAQRADDNPETIRERLKLYRQNAGKLIRYYSGKAYHRIGAARKPEEVSRELLWLAGREIPMVLQRRVPGYRIQPA